MASNNDIEVSLGDISGGLASAKQACNRAPNELAEANNIVILPGGSGFRNRYGNTTFNASAMASGAAVTGLGYFSPSSGSTWLMAVAGSNIYKSDDLDGVMDSITGALTVTSGQNNWWDIVTFDDLAIGVGSGDAPWKWSGTGNAAALGGTPPNGQGAVVHNNRVFIWEGSTIHWCVLDEPEDWSGDGSGEAEVQKDDGDTVLRAVPLGLNQLLVFKRNSVHVLTGRTSPFPLFRLFDNVGAVGKRAIVAADELCYFITPRRKMVITDGQKLVSTIDLPQLSNVDDKFASLNAARLPYIVGSRLTGSDFDWIIWSASDGSATTNDVALVWDLRHKCWLYCGTGFAANSFVTTNTSTTAPNISYMGGYDGKIYKLNVSGTYTDASNSSTAVAWELRSDWLTLESLMKVARLQRFNIAYKSVTQSNNATFSYGYDFSEDQRSQAFSLISRGAKWDQGLWDQATFSSASIQIQPCFTLGRGNVFQWALSGSAAQDFTFHRFSLFGRQNSQKHFLSK